MKRKKVKGTVKAGELSVLRRDVAGADLGSREHYVCAPALQGDGRDVESFGSITAELYRMADWLKARGVKSVAMESTGVYWISVYEVLESRGFEVVLVNARALLSVPGRKTDVLDCQWIQLLHSCGLLKGSFRPADDVCALRALIRERSTLIAESADWIRRMQKSLDQMNIRVHHAVADLSGVTGMAIVRAIVGGERDPKVLAGLRDARCHKTVEEIAEHLRGNWRAEHLFALGQALKLYDFIQARKDEYDQEIMQALKKLEQASMNHQDGSGPDSEREDEVPEKTRTTAGAGSVVSDERNRFDHDRWDRCRNGRNRVERNRHGSVELSNGAPFCILLEVVSQAGDQRGQAHFEQETAFHLHACWIGASDGGNHLEKFQDRVGRRIPPVRPLEGNGGRRFRHGPQIGYPDLPSSEVRSSLSRPRR